MKLVLKYGFFCLCLLLCSSAASAQDLILQITVGDQIHISGRIARPRTTLNFVENYANATDLSRRIENVTFSDNDGRPLESRQIAPGKYQSSSAQNFGYDVRLTQLKNHADAAHVSSSGKDYALLMLNDLLPDFENTRELAAKIVFAAPANWKIATSEMRVDSNKFQTANVGAAIFLLGAFAEDSTRVDQTEIRAAQIGKWSFSNTETLDVASKIFTAHKKTFGGFSDQTIQILLLPLPQNFAGESWEAETRGSTVVVLAGDSGFKSRALSKLHEQLRHELFHLWIPNLLRLSGDYAWFYEGCALYQSLKIGLRLNYIRFADFLDTLARAFDIARSAANNRSLNLLEASRLRWAIGNTEFIYAKGLLVAFLCDAAMLDKSNGNRSLDQIFSQLYQQFRVPINKPNANDAVLSTLRAKPEIALIAQKFVESASPIEWLESLRVLGLQSTAPENRLTRITIAADATKRQRKLLEKLGYNPIYNSL